MMSDANPLTLSSLIVDPARSCSLSLFIVCPVCHLKLSSSFELRRHAISEHLIIQPGVPNRVNHLRRFTCKVFTCAACGASSSECSAVEKHFRRNHSSLANDHSTKCAILAQRVKLTPFSENSSDSEDEQTFLQIGTKRKPDSTATISNITVNSSPVAARPQALSAVRPLSSSVAPIKPSPSGPAAAAVTRAQSQLPATTMSVGTRPTRTGTPVSAEPVSPRTSTPVPTVRNKVPIPACDRPVQPIKGRSQFQNWSELILRSEKKFMCMLCRRCIYSGRTEVVFHAVTRHLLATEIEHDLSHYARLSDPLKRQIGQYFADGMRIRSGVHYKDAKRVEAALFRSIELHLRYHEESKNATTTTSSGAGESLDKVSRRVLKCSGCAATFTESHVAYSHVNEELRVSLPEFMRARSCPWSLSSRDEWVWCVPDLPIEPLPGKSTVTGVGGVSDPNEEVQLVLGDRIHKLGVSRASDVAGSNKRGPPPIAPSATSTESTPVNSSGGNSITQSTTTNILANVSNSSASTSSIAPPRAAVDVVKSLVAVAGLLQPKPVTCVSTSLGSATAAIPIATPIFKIEATDPMDHLVVRPG